MKPILSPEDKKQFEDYMVAKGQWYFEDGVLLNSDGCYPDEELYNYLAQAIQEAEEKTRKQAFTEAIERVNIFADKHRNSNREYAIILDWASIYIKELRDGMKWDNTKMKFIHSPSQEET